jgi:hypothetical protein
MAAETEEGGGTLPNFADASNTNAVINRGNN